MSHYNRDIWLIRHAPACPPGYLYGHTDADIGQIETATQERLQQKLADCQYLCSSPAKRCVRTCEALFPDHTPPHLIAAFWEQYFGDWEGLAYPDLPDLGSMNGQELAKFTPPNGESFWIYVPAYSQRFTPCYRMWMYSRSLSLPMQG